MKNKPCHVYVKEKGVKSVKALCTFLGIHQTTFNNWYRKGELGMCDAAIARYNKAIEAANNGQNPNC